MTMYRCVKRTALLTHRHTAHNSERSKSMRRIFAAGLVLILLMSTIACHTDSGQPAEATGSIEQRTPDATMAPTPEPAAVPTPEPTAVSTPEPSAAPTPEPTATSTPEPSSVDLLMGTWILEAMESEDESQSGQIAIVNALIAAGKYQCEYTFLPSGDGLAYWDIQGEKSAFVFTYVVDGDKLTFSDETMTFAIDADRLTLRELHLTLIFKRRAEDADTEQESSINDRVFYGDGYQITLTDQFSEQQSEEGFDGYYTSSFGGVMIMIEPFTMDATLAAKSTEDYIRDVIKNNQTDAEPEAQDGLLFYRYRRTGLCGWNFAFKGSDAFYLVQFICRESDESTLSDLFFTFAKSMKVD